MQIKFCWRQIFEILIHKPSLGSLDVPDKFVPDRFSRFDVYQFQTNKQTSKQSIYIELVFSFGGTHVLCTYIVYMYYVRTLNTCTMYVHCIHVLCTYILYMYYVRTLYTWTTFNFVKRLSLPTLISVLLSYVCHCHKFFLFHDFHVHVCLCHACPVSKHN